MQSDCIIGLSVQSGPLMKEDTHTHTHLRHVKHALGEAEMRRQKAEGGLDPGVCKLQARRLQGA